MPYSQAVTLMSNGTGNGDDVSWQGGKSSLLAEGTFGGGSVKLQVKLPNDNYADVANMSLSANGMLTTDLPMGVYRVVATTATAVYARLVTVPT